MIEFILFCMLFGMWLITWIHDNSSGGDGGGLES